MQNLQETISKLAEDYIDGMIDDSGMIADDFYKQQSEFYKNNESHICDCFTDTSHFVKDIEGAKENDLQSKVEAKIVELVHERANS